MAFAYLSIIVLSCFIALGVSLALGEFGAIYHVLSNIKELNLIRLYQITHFLDGWILEKLHYLCGKGVF